MSALITNVFCSEETGYITREKLQMLLEQKFGVEIDFKIRVRCRFRRHLDKGNTSG